MDAASFFMNHLIFQKRTLYKLRQSYGTLVDFYRVSGGNTVDFTTGVKSATRTKYEVTVIKLPKRGRRGLGSYNGIQAPFKYGGSFDLNAQNFIIESANIDFTPEEDSDYIITGMEKYNIKKVHQLDYGFYLFAEATEGAELVQVFEPSVTTTICQTQTVSGNVV